MPISTGPHSIPFGPDAPTITPSPTLQAQYGIQVMATEFPSWIEVYEALETGVGAGTYGTSASTGKIPAVAGDWTRFIKTAPIDGLNRRLKARHVRDGTTASSFTAEVTVNPGVALALVSSSPAGSDVTAVVDAVWAGSPNDGANTIPINFSYTGAVGTGSFELRRVRTAGTIPDHGGTQSSVGTSSAASPIAITDSLPDDIAGAGVNDVVYSYLVRVKDATGVVLRVSSWLDYQYAYN